jgi:hypothetical protein
LRDLDCRCSGHGFNGLGDDPFQVSVHKCVEYALNLNPAQVRCSSTTTALLTGSTTVDRSTQNKTRVSYG